MECISVIESTLYLASKHLWDQELKHINIFKSLQINYINIYMTCVDTSS